MMLSKANIINKSGMVIAPFLMSLCGLASNIIWANWVEPSVFGSFKVIFNYVNMVSALCLMGAASALVMSAAQNYDGNFKEIFRAKLTANAIGALLLLGISISYYLMDSVDNKNLSEALIVVAICFPLLNSSDVWTSWLNGKGLFRNLAMGRITLYVIPLISVSIIALMSANIFIVALIYFSSLSVYNLIMVRKLKGSILNDLVNRDILLFGRHSNISMTFGGLISIDVILINSLYAPSDVAIYSIALVLPEIVRMPITIINQLLAPRVNDGRNLIYTWKEYSRYFILINLFFSIVGLIGWVTIPEILPLIFSDKYLESADYAKWLWLVMCITGPVSILGSSLIATKRLLFTYGAYIGYPVLMVLMYIFLSSAGVEGMITARIISIVGLHLFYALGFIWYVRRYG